MTSRLAAIATLSCCCLIAAPVPNPGLESPATSPPVFLAGEYDPALPAAAEPTRNWRTLLGSVGRDFGFGTAVDPSGNIYVVGRSKRNWGVPVSRYNGGKGDAFVAKLGSSGELIWNTFLGSTADDLAVGIAVGPNGVYVSGASGRSWGTPIRAFSGRYDAFVASLSPEGALRWNTFIGSSGIDGGAGIASDAAGNVYLSGASTFSWGTPVREFGWGGGSDAFVAKLNPAGTLQWNTFLGSNGHDTGLGLALDGAGNILVCGSSKATWGTPIRAYSGGGDGFVAKVSGAAGTLLWNTFLGSSDQDDAVGAAADSAGILLVVGRSKATWGSPVSSHTGGVSSFAARLDGAGKLTWNTFLGSSGESDYQGRVTSPFTRSADGDGAVAVALDGQGNAFIAGASTGAWGGATTPDDDSDAEAGYLAKLDSSGVLRWSTFMGIGRSAGMGIATDGRGGIFVAGIASDGGNRTLYYDSFVAKYSDVTSASPRPTPGAAGRRLPGTVR